MIKIAVIPIDNRPICYDLINDILSIDNNIKLYMPNIKYLGDLTTQSNINKIFEFLENLENMDFIIVSLDTVAYGGLIPSRRVEDDFETIKERIKKFKNIIQTKTNKILAFSSVMRISNNNINEEEKPYWSQWGKRIFDWSYYLHKSEVEKSYNCVINKVPENILEDYIKTRKRNFEINKIYLDWAKEGFFDTLIFSKDDCAEFGLNVKEANELQKIINENNIKQTFIKTGADEIPLGLITRALSKNQNIKINPVFLEKNSTNLISKYEDISIYDCVKGQILLAGCNINKNDFDLEMIINNFKNEQGDLVLGDIINQNKNKISLPLKNYFIADVNNANGSDLSFIETIFKKTDKNFFGYCAYNTSANTIGCALFCAVVKFLAAKNNSYNELAFKKIQFIRFLDDWAYQAIIRKFIREKNPDFIQALTEKENDLNKYAEQISKFLNFYPKKISYSLPWNRSFEIRIKIN